MNTQAKMLAEEKALEEKLFGTPSETETTVTEAPVVVEPVIVAPIVEPVVAEQEEKPTVVEPIEQEREEDWKLRFTNLRASRDSKLGAIQTKLAKSDAQIVILQQKIQELIARKPEIKEDIYKDAFTAEEREALGDTAIAAMQRTADIASSAKTKAIQAELDEARANAVAAAELNAKDSAKAAYDSFLDRLNYAVPDFLEVDKDPAFRTFIESNDLDGSPRLASFQAAEARKDAAAVARYMLDFKREKDPKAAAKAALESQIGVTGAVSAAAVVKPKDGGDLTMTQVDAHYKKHALGGYKGKHKEYLAMEARIDAAAVGGKIIRG